jgi:sugar/nucleoside kinase (ribokinase family)
MYIAVGYVIIDDVVLPDGTTHMGLLGGGSVHAIMGMRVWSKQVGLVAGIGRDFPAELREKLEELFDVRGLYELNFPTIRAWQLFEQDGTRREVFRTDINEFPAFNPKIEEYPSFYNDLQGVHLHCKWSEVKGWATLLRQYGNPLIFWEPIQSECIAENHENFLKTLPFVDCISPNLQEAQATLGRDDANDLLNELVDHGANMAIIRAGAEGSMYADATGCKIRVPIVEVDKIVDQTGAGNSYCGGFIVGYAQSHDPQEALCKAAVSASFTLEQFGALFSVENREKVIEARYQACLRVMRTMI